MGASSGPHGGGSSGYKRVAMKCGQRTGLSLLPCPECGEEILELVAAPGSKVPGAIFFKCRLHERDVPGTCPWYMFADKYERMLTVKGLIDGTRVDNAQEVQVFSEELGGLQGGEHAVPVLQSTIAGLDDKLKKLVELGKIGVVFCVVLVVLLVVGVVIGVIRMLLK